MGVLEDRAALAGRVAVVAGGAGGLGRAISLDLARAGVALAVADVDEVALSSFAGEAAATGVDVLTHRLDVRDPEALAAFFEAAGTRYDRLDVLVNVVGGTFHAPFVDIRPKGVDTLVRTNFTWVVDAIRLAVQRMSALGAGGSVINLTSIEAHRAAPGYAVYSAMKAAVTQLTRVLAVELGPSGIRVNCIAPDIVPTEGMGHLLGQDGDGDDQHDTMAIPLGRYGQAEDVGNSALFLASDLSSYITGVTLHPDGGAWAASGWLNWPGVGWAARPPTAARAGRRRDGPTATE